MNDSFPCELCHHNGTMWVWSSSKNLLQCPKCTLIYYSQRVNPADIYTLPYFTGDEYVDYLGDETSFRKNFEKRLIDIKKYKSGGRLLEIGSAFGLFLDVARSSFEVEGIEIVPEAAQFARKKGFTIHEKDFLEMSPPSKLYDVICLWDTIEHLSYPVRVIEKAAQWLTTNGFLLITTSDIDSKLARWRGEKWRQIHPPSHLFYFSRQTLQKACEQSGLRIKESRYIGYYRNLTSALIQSILEKGASRDRIIRWAKKWPWLNFSFYLNLFDTLLVVAEKPVQSNLKTPHSP